MQCLEETMVEQSVPLQLMEVSVEQISTHSYGGPPVEGCALQEDDDHEEEHRLEQGKGVRGAVAESTCYRLIITPCTLSPYNSGRGRRGDKAKGMKLRLGCLLPSYCTFIW